MKVRRVSVREARKQFSRLLDQVKAGDEVVVLRRGVEVGKLVRPEQKPVSPPDLDMLRASVKLRRRPLSRVIADARRKSRF